MLAGSFILVVLLAAVFVVMLLGVILMGTGGKKNSQYGNKLMVARVVLQGLVLGAIFLIYLLSNSK